MISNTSPWARRVRAAGIHLCISLTIAAFAAALVFGVWYPYPYREISGGRELFMLVVAVDVVLGPLLTFAVFNVAKAWPVLKRDLVVIGCVQLAALGYGLWSVSQARPVHLVFEINRFQVVNAIDVKKLLDKAPPEFRQLPLHGPTLVSVRDFKNNKEQMEATFAAFELGSIAVQPQYWQPYENARAQILGVARPLAELKARFPARVAEIDAALNSAGRPVSNVVSVPMIGRDNFWTVLLDGQQAQVIAFVPIDSF